VNSKRSELVEVLREARAFLARPGNDFAWSSWDDASSALREIDDIIARIEVADMPDRSISQILFAPTGPIQEVSLSSGWGDEFLDLSSRFDAAIEQAYGTNVKKKQRG